MRRAPFLAAAALGLLALPGCLVSSLHPAYDAESIVYDEALLGTWQNTENEITVTISRAEWRSYDVEFADRTGRTRYHGHLTGIGSARVFNVIPHGGLEAPALMVATNGVMQVDVGSGGIRVREPDYTVVLERLKRGTLGIQVATDIAQNVIITASTARFRAWLAMALKDDALWSGWKTFTRTSR